MKRSIILYILGKILLVESFLLLLPALIGIIYREDLRQIGSYLIVASILGIISFFTNLRKPNKLKLRSRDGMAIVALGWICLSFFGAIPLVLTGEMPNIFDAFFEISSGFTTTGSSVLSSLSGLAHSTLFWRSFTHLIGGMGVLVFTLAVLPNASEYVQLMKAEVPGPVFGKLVSKLSGTARILYGMYLLLTFILVIILCIIKVPLFDALLLAFGTAGTGGFGINNAGFAIYAHPAAVEWIIGIGMLLFGINFNVYYYMLIGYAKTILKEDEELRYYLGIVLAVTILICMNIFNMYQSFEPMVRNVFFTVASIITTTGYSTANFEEWPIFSHALLIILMFIGGCAGSTAGGIKISRVVIYFKEAIAELKRAAHPGRVIVPKLSGKPLGKVMENQVAHYLMIYIVFFIALLLSVSLEAKDFTTAFTTVAATFNNIGPGLGLVGPTENFGFYSNWNKFVISIGMIAGRLEIYPVIILFSPNTLKKFI